MKILLLEPYLTGSHQVWAEEYARFSRHAVAVMGMPGQFWKWRMHGGAVTLAGRFMAETEKPDLVLASDMLDLSTFLALTRAKTAAIRTALYFHENQLCYPWSPTDRDRARRRDMHYCFINYASALAADRVFFNSEYHMQAFLKELPRFLKHFPDCNGLGNIDLIRDKSSVLPLGLDLQAFDAVRARPGKKAPRILWNHRWEYDKNPEDFFAALYALADAGLDFEVVVLGENFSQSPQVFDKARQRLGRRIVQFGYAESFADYAAWVKSCDIVPVTSRHDFFGISVVQAIYAGCCPLLPDRQAYPDHIPDAWRERYIYRDQADLVARLKKFVAGGVRAVPDNLSDHVARYDWTRMAPVYDAVLEGLGHGCSVGYKKAGT